MLEMTSEKLFGHNAYIEIFQAGMCPGWTYRLPMEKPVCRLVCREHPYTKGVKGEKFAFDVDKTLAIGLFKKSSKFQLRLSPWVSPFPCFEYGEFRLMIGSDYGSIKVEWGAPDEDNEQDYINIAISHIENGADEIVEFNNLKYIISIA